MTYNLLTGTLKTALSQLLKILCKNYVKFCSARMLCYIEQFDYLLIVILIKAVCMLYYDSQGGATLHGFQLYECFLVYP